MLAPTNSPREILASAQLAARDFFGPLGDIEQFPRSFVVVRSADGEAAPAAPAAPAAFDRPRRDVLVERDADHLGARVRPSGVGRREHPRVRLGSGRPDRDALLRRARRDGPARRVEGPARLPARVRARAEEPARSRGRADVRRAQRRQAQRHVQPEAPGGRRAGAPARRRVGRRGRRELRAARDARLRPRLRHARRGQARPRDGQRVPERPDRPAQGLPRLRRPGLGARRGTTG